MRKRGSTADFTSDQLVLGNLWTATYSGNRSSVSGKNTYCDAHALPRTCGGQNRPMHEGSLLVLVARLFPSLKRDLHVLSAVPR